jgi:hypothetical protein
MIHTVTKKQIIKALCTEPLKAGKFFDLDPEANLGLSDNNSCAVCAVGAVLRATARKHFSNSDAFEIVPYTLPHELDDAWDSGELLSILSTEFELASAHDGDELARLHAINVVEAIFPETFSFEV